MEYKTVDQCLEERQALLTRATALVEKDGATAEDMANARQMLDDAKALLQRSQMLKDLETATAETKSASPMPRASAAKFGKFGEQLQAIHGATFKGKGDSRLTYEAFKGEGDFTPKTANVGEWEQKDLVENTGASGGFLVAPEFRAQLMMLLPLQQYVRNRALVLPMRGRQLTIPTLDQSGTTAGVSHFYGGVVPYWTEEGKYKEESQPAFRQMELVAHKLVVYTEATDELLADSAVGLEALLSRLFAETIANEEERTFINGTGAGQPLGVVNAGATRRVPRAVANQINIADIFNMVASFMGSTPIWLAHQSTMPQLLNLNGPAGNPSYLWIGNGRDTMPTTLMGYPVYFTENNPTLGAEGDIVLADWSKYVVGDRQATTIDASKHYRFQYDLTAWRAVHRVDGRPWLSAPLTYRDGTTQVSPFVILDDSVQS